MMSLPQIFLGAWLLCTAALMWLARRKQQEDEQDRPGFMSQDRWRDSYVVRMCFAGGLICAVPVTLILQLLALTVHGALTF